MPKPPREIAGFVVLPVALHAATWPVDTKHYLYVKPHEPHIPDESTGRSLFMVNIPISTTEAHIRHLFSTQLQAGRIEKVVFPDSDNHETALTSTSKTSRKRKRQTVEELEVGLNLYHLPPSLPSNVSKSGSSAVAVFVDRPSMESSLKAVRKVTKSGTEIVWAQGLEANAARVGLARYELHKTLQYPPQSELLRIVDSYMMSYSALEAARSQEKARKHAEPDDDGFVTVTRGTKGGILSKEEADELRAKQRKKEGNGLEDFYRFQTREKRKEKQGQMLKRFEEDKRRLSEMKKRRGVLRPEA